MFGVPNATDDDDDVVTDGQRSSAGQTSGVWLLASTVYVLVRSVRC